MDDPRRTLLAIRRFELLAGALSLGCGLALWGDGCWHWLLIACGVIALSPYPGLAAILRRARTHPEILNHDRKRGRRRGIRTVTTLVPVYALLAGVAGYVLDGWPAAIFMAVLIGGSAALGGWLYLNLSRQR
jgi:hypothetical protein